MIQRYPAHERNQFDIGWLKGGRSFSFGDYQDPENMAFGPMRVCNDDTIAPGKGFGAHPHSDMEIVSLVLSGELRHEDSLGNEAVTTFGGVQRMSAGTGVIHTEHNPSLDTEVNLLQMWFMPKEKGLQPSYATSQFDPEEMKGRLLPIVSSASAPGVASIGQDLTIYLSRLAEGEKLVFHQEPGRRIFVFVIEGRLELNGTAPLEQRDHARIWDQSTVELAGSTDVFYMLIDLP
ncbi:pirin family protein [Paenibacillus sp. CAA11]|uniref:pirin family protein n=1 Tax=Paenibacillus sp. CAA11 TaxID=1532905 RepID=UPI000D3798F2|nr:pirin family protein [Paenibacillus sp. CAA11]AWB43572.1 pirin family protein [Paenibacillus sp. CAA11]